MDSAPLVFEKVLGSLRPSNGAATEALKAIEGRCVVKITRMTRNQRRRAWYWVMLDVVAEVMADKTGTPWDAETLHEDIRERLGMGEWLQTMSGRRKFKFRSTSDKAMTEIDRARWTDRVATYLSRQIGVEMQELINEVRQRGGGEPPAAPVGEPEYGI